MSYQLLSIVGMVLSPIVGYLVYKWRVRVDLDAKKEGQQIDVQILPYKLLEDELKKREAELFELRVEDKKERGTYIETLTAMRKALEEIAIDMRAQREESRQHAVNVHKRIDVLDNRLLVIETRLETK